MNTKRIVSLLLLVTLIMAMGMGVFAEMSDTAEIAIATSDSTETVVLTKLSDEEVQEILNNPNTVTETIVINTRAPGFTAVNISTSKNGSTATVVITSSASSVCSQIGFKDGYIQNAGSIGPDYKTNTSTYSAGYSFTMKDNTTYQASVTHHCKLSAGGEYTQAQTSSTFTK